MGVSAADLAEALAVTNALPGEDWRPAGNPAKPYGLNYRYSGGSRHVGGDGSIPHELVRFILIAHALLPRLVEEHERLSAEVARLTDLNKKLRAKSAASSRT
jgi:hypothetical protein